MILSTNSASRDSNRRKTIPRSQAKCCLAGKSHSPRAITNNFTELLVERRHRWHLQIDILLAQSGSQPGIQIPQTSHKRTSASPRTPWVWVDNLGPSVSRLK